MFAQIINGRIVGLSETEQPHFDVPVELPEDFDWEHISRYGLTDDGELIRHDLPEEARPSVSDADMALIELAALTAENAQRLDEQEAALIELAALIEGGRKAD